ncbi:MAG: translation initiation factor IF-3 [Clostridia bacterium]|nr:translation initiation factor IF-3 [Clostridia bacterium]MBQ3154634.1 translation initiation factor IF-3 [Clostridia bacterium]
MQTDTELLRRFWGKNCPQISRTDVETTHSIRFSFFQFYLEVLNIATADKTLVNEAIRATEIRVIGPEGQLGIMKTADALRIAGDLGLDLVEVSPDSKPPVCKIMDYGKYHFEREKKEKEQRKKKPSVELKEIQLRCRIDTHDFNTKLKHCIEFLQKGNKVKVLVRFFGREMAHTEVGIELLNRFAEGCGDIVSVERAPLLDGRNMIMMLAPKKATDTKNKSKGTETNG